MLGTETVDAVAVAVPKRSVDDESQASTFLLAHMASAMEQPRPPQPERPRSPNPRDAFRIDPRA